MDFLTRMRSKSPIVRMQYALGIAGLTTGVVTAIWISTIPARFAEMRDGATTTTETRTPTTDTTKTPPAVETEAEALGSLRMNAATTTPTTTPQKERETIPLPAASSTGARVIQIGTTSQNAY